MKSRVTKDIVRTPKEYPCIKYSKASRNLYLMSDRHNGVCIGQLDGSHAEIGRMDNSLSMSNITMIDFHGEVTIDTEG